MGSGHGEESQKETSRMNILFASHNRFKLKEVERLLPEGVQLICLADMPDSRPVEETGQTLMENAEIKAVAAFERYGLPSFADDSGLFVHALGGRPGVHSARFAGMGADDKQNMAKLLEELEGIRDRSAYFATCIAFRDWSGSHFFEGRIVGNITEAARGHNGFGYDPLFQPEGRTNTFAEMDSVVKEQLSHRAQAIRSFTDFLQRHLKAGSGESPPSFGNR